MIAEDGERVKPTKCAFCIPDIAYNFWRVIIGLQSTQARARSNLYGQEFHFHTPIYIVIDIVKMLRVLSNVRVRSAKSSRS